MGLRGPGTTYAETAGGLRADSGDERGLNGLAATGGSCAPAHPSWSSAGHFLGGEEGPGGGTTGARGGDLAAGAGGTRPVAPAYRWV